MADDDLALFNLRDDVFLKICNSLDAGDLKTFKTQVQLKLSGQWRANLHSAQEVLHECRVRGMTVLELAKLLNELKLEEPMSHFIDDHPVKLVQDLPEEMVVNEGNSLILKCEATGFLFPKYQWYRCRVGNKEMTRIDDQMSSTLEIHDLCASDAGTYACQAYNYSKNGKKFTTSTKMTRVTVLIESSLINDESEEENGHPVITFQPCVPRQIEIGSSIILEVKAEGKGKLNYEWYKDGQHIPDSNNCRLEVSKIQPNCEQRRWTYQCRVSNAVGVIMSDIVDIVLAPCSLKTQYRAEDKVALLIGNGNFTYLHPLHSAVEDVVTLSLLLKSLNFKVIALSDLNLDEMKNAVRLFCSLLDKGVYGVFYYAGHGFERDKQTYMLPVNAINSNSVSNSLCAEFIQAEMQKKAPALVAFFLDMCRMEPETASSEPNHEVIERYKSAPHPNFVIAYATTSGSRAYEHSGQKNGIFVGYLKTFITERLPIKEVVDKVIIAVNNDPLAGALQHPCTYQGLCEALSLTDPIDSTNPTSKKRGELFRSITQCPNGFISSLAPLYPEIPMQMTITKHKLCLLNGIDIVLQVFTRDARYDFEPYLVLDDEKIVIKNMTIDRPGQEIMHMVSILGIQKLKTSIIGKVCCYDKTKNQKIEWAINLGNPLIMAANLWELKQSAKPVEEDSWVDPQNNSRSPAYCDENENIN